MSNILYYSNYCENCKKLLKILNLNKPKEKVHYICIDNREKGHGNQLYVILETQQKILLPPTVTKVPALLLLDKGHQVTIIDNLSTGSSKNIPKNATFYKYDISFF